MVGQKLTLEIALRANATIGIRLFELTRNGVALIEKDDFGTTIFNITYDYEIGDEDFYDTPVALDMKLVDGNGTVVTESISIDSIR